MEHITTSRVAVGLLIVAAFFFAVASAFATAGYATLTADNLGTFRSLLHAAQWLYVTAAITALVAVCTAGWEVVLRRSWAGAWEVGAGALGTLLIAIGTLITAASESTNVAANVVSAVGIGVWAVLVLSRAARRSLAEEKSASAGSAPLPRQAMLWLVAAGGLLVLAVGYGFTQNVTNSGVGIAAGALEAVGVAVLLGSLAVARAEGYLHGLAVLGVLAGLAVLFAAFAAIAVVAAVVFGPGVTLTGIGVGVSIAIGLQLLAGIVLGLAAWERLRQLELAQLPAHTRTG
jgi:hypothetical protein